MSAGAAVSQCNICIDAVVTVQIATLLADARGSQGMLPNVA
jgi:hypothetical protein